MEQAALSMLGKELKEQVLPWALLPQLVVGMTLVVADHDAAPPPSLYSLGMLLLLLAAFAWFLRRRHYLFAAWVTNLGSLGVTFVAWLWFPSELAHYALVLPIISTAVTLAPTAAVLLAALATMFLVSGRWIGVGSPSAGAIVGSTTVLWCATYLVCIAHRPYNTMVAWAWQGYEQARRNLEEARDHRLQLTQALEDLSLANTETVRLNDLLSAARLALQEARKAKEELVANVSHEFRTPLNMIIGFSDMILESPEVYSRRLPPVLLADIAAIRRNSDHLASLVDDVLDMAEADTGRLQLAREWVGMDDVIGEAIDAVGALFAKKRLSLTVDIPADLPPAHCDRTRIRQVILNLLSNAGRFTSNGGATVETRVSDGSLVVTIVDTGPGMDSDTLRRLFEPFHQGDPSIRRRYGGTGLGLAISKRFVEMHGGRIWLENAADGGTRASFSLPLCDEPPAGDAKRWFGPYSEYTPRTRGSLAPSHSSKPQVLIVERGDELRNLVARYLEDLIPVSVQSIAEAEHVARSTPVVAIAINQAATIMASAGPSMLPDVPMDIPILFCPVPERRAKLAGLGAQDYLVKPVKRVDLLASIERTAPMARTVLIADDDAEARQLFTRMLNSRDRGYTILNAEDGREALSLLRERQPDLLVLDMVLPHLDGFAVLEAKAEEDAIRGIPVIIVSATDPVSEPIVSMALTVTRPQGLSARDLMRALESITRTLTPRFAAPEPPERHAAW